MKIVKANSLPLIKSAVAKYAEFIAPTYGPAGKKVLIAINEFNLKAADDGFAASAEFELENEFENAVIMYIREATSKTNSRVGDGTTTAGLLTAAILDQVINLDEFADKNYFGKVQAIQKATKEAVLVIKNKAKKVKTKQELYKIAYNSFNDEQIATLISDTLFKIGEDGLLAIEDSQTTTTEVEIIEGLELEKGMASPYFINTNKDEVLLNDPAIILIKDKLDSFGSISSLIKSLLENGKNQFVILAEGFSEEVMNNFILNRMKGLFNVLLIETPGFGEQKLDHLKNLSAISNSLIIDSKLTKFTEITPEQFGTIKKVIATKDKTTFIGGTGNIRTRIELLEKNLDSATEIEQGRIKKSIAVLKGGIALIKVGANTENEQKSIKMKVEDAVNATRIAYKDGIVKGAGRTYAEIKTSSEILNKVLQAPAKQLEINGKEYLDLNVTDPAGVLIAALETASSIACGLLMMGGIITTKRKEEKE